jgi:adenylate kinase
MNFALLGPTCAGKSTLASILMDYFHLTHISPGQLLREHRDRRTALGIMTRRYIDRGELVPDEIVAAIIEEAVCHTPPSDGVLFDGFPVTEYQARFLDDLLQSYDRQFDAAIYLPVPEAIVFERAGKRIPRRSDDSPEILKHRLRSFDRTTGPVLRSYAESGRLAIIQASPPVDSVYRALSSLVEDLAMGRLPVLTASERLWLENMLQLPVLHSTTSSRPSLNLILIGGPGCGKGTHAAHICEHLRLPHISTGNLFRDNITQRTELGKIANSYMENGELVPDDITESMVQKRLAQPDAANGFLLDGFPRTMPQVHALDEILSDMNRELNGVVYLNVPDGEIMYRTSGRRICPVCQSSYHTEYKRPKAEGVCDKDGAGLVLREDDDPETVAARLKTFHGQTSPLIGHYRAKGLLEEVSGMDSVDHVKVKMLAAVRKFQSQAINNPAPAGSPTTMA